MDKLAQKKTQSLRQGINLTYFLFMFNGIICDSFEEAREAAQRMYELQKRNLGNYFILG
jgi:hypothetical protein